MPTKKSCRALFPHVCVKDSLHQPAILSPAGCPKVQLNSDAIYPEIESNFPDKELSWKSVCVCVCVCVCVQSFSCVWLWHLCPLNFQARILEQGAGSYSRGSSQPRDQSHVSVSPGLIGTFFTTVLPGKHPQWKKTPFQMPVSSPGLLPN